MFGAAMGKRANALFHTFLIGVHQQLHAYLFRHLVPEANHLPELPGGIHMHQRERRLTRREGFHGQVQHDG